MSSLVGIIALDLSGGHFHEYYAADADPDDDRAWAKFVLRCTNLQSASPKGHADLVTAAIQYATTGDKVPEKEEMKTTIEAFMGENFDVSALGTWIAILDAQAFNRMVISGRIEKTFVFVYRHYNDSD